MAKSRKRRLKSQSKAKSALKSTSKSRSNSNLTSSTNRKKLRKCYSIAQVESALSDIEGGVSVRRAALKYNVPRTTLIDLTKGRYTADSRPGPSPVLSYNEEKLLSEWVIEMAKRGIPMNRDCLLDSVQKILADDPQRQTPFTDGRPGMAWFSGFMRRHPELSIRQAESISRSRGAVTEESIRGWFSDLDKAVKDRSIEYVLTNSSRQYNGDETGFQLDPHVGKVLGPKGQAVYTETGGLREQMTVLVTSRADGKLMTCAIVYPYKRSIPKAIIDGIPAGFCAARSDKGWMNSEVFFEYMANTFIPELAAERRREKGLSDTDELLLDDSDWVVYWLDGYSSHLTLHTSKLCDVNKVMLYCFKAHASHICQPNDLGPFKPLKSEWKNAVAEWRLHHPYEVLSRVNFADVLAKAVTNLSPEAIVAGYRAAGLYPFDPEAVHYERLTVTNQQKYDHKAFAVSEETEHQITLRCIEAALGPQLVSSYKQCNGIFQPADVPALSAYELWKYFRETAECVTDEQTENKQLSAFTQNDAQINGHSQLGKPINS